MLMEYITQDQINFSDGSGGIFPPAEQNLLTGGIQTAGSQPAVSSNGL